MLAISQKVLLEKLFCLNHLFQISTLLVFGYRIEPLYEKLK